MSFITNLTGKCIHTNFFQKSEATLKKYLKQ